MRIAVTGADGFTGRYVTAELERRGLEWVAIEADLRDADAVAKAVARESFDALIHLAAIAFVGGSDWRAFYEVNQTGSFNLLEAVATKGERTICLLASSAQIYGASAEGMVDENAACHPKNHYALSKYAMELGAAFWADRLDIRIARPFNYSGVGQEGIYLIPKIVDHFARRAPVIELGNLTVQRDFGDVRAVAAAYCDLIAADAPGLLTNIATGRLHSIGDIIAMLRAVTGHDLEVRVNPAFVRAGDVPVLGGDISRLSATIPGWHPLELRDTLTWMLASAELTPA